MLFGTAASSSPEYNAMNPWGILGGAFVVGEVVLPQPKVILVGTSSNGSAKFFLLAYQAHTGSNTHGYAVLIPYLLGAKRSQRAKDFCCPSWPIPESPGSGAWV